MSHHSDAWNRHPAPIVSTLVTVCNHDHLNHHHQQTYPHPANTCPQICQPQMCMHVSIACVHKIGRVGDWYEQVSRCGHQCCAGEGGEAKRMQGCRPGRVAGCWEPHPPHTLPAHFAPPLFPNTGRYSAMCCITCSAHHTSHATRTGAPAPNHHNKQSRSAYTHSHMHAAHTHSTLTAPSPSHTLTHVDQ